ncbi:hypothetical protein Q8G40_30605, partial [Klebsiella pneumoniae]
PAASAGCSTATAGTGGPVASAGLLSTYSPTPVPAEPVVARAVASSAMAATVGPVAPVGLQRYLAPVSAVPAAAAAPR